MLSQVSAVMLKLAPAEVFILSALREEKTTNFWLFALSLTYAFYSQMKMWRTENMNS